MARAGKARGPSGRGTPAFRFVLLVGILSLFADMVYEGAHSVNGQYLRHLGASAAAVGTVAGLGELAAYGLRFLSGRWVDRTRLYWPTTIAGYTINLLAVPAVALAGHWLAAAALMVLERTGKAIRNPPRDAILSHAAHQVGEGWAWGIHEALDETGAALGPLLVAGLLWIHSGYRLAYAILLLPAIVSLVLLLWARRMNPRPEHLEPAALHRQPGRFTARYWTFAAAGALVGFGFADFSLMAYHIDRTGVLAAPLVPLLYAMANGLNAGSALGAGRAFDAWGPRILAGAILVPIASAPLVFLGGADLVLAGLVLWAFGVTVQQTLFKALLNRIVPANRRAFGFGTFDGIWGVASFLGGVALGLLYDVGRVWLVAVSVAVQALAVPLVWAAVWGLRARPSPS